jgi:type II secretion system protein G
MTKGFTLIELLVVIFIIGILIALSVFGLQGARKSARDAQRKTDLEEIRSGLEIYKADCGVYPPDLDWGASLTGTEASCSPTGSTYITEIPVDPTPAVSSYSYNRPTLTTYTLCATLEQGSSHCVQNP